MSQEGDGQMSAQRRAEAPPLDGLASIFSSDVDDPREGELWRAGWGDCVQLVLVVETGDVDIDAAPASPDIGLVDDHALSLEAVGPLVHPLAVWSGLRRRVPIRVLEHRVASVGASELEAVRRGDGTGAPITSVLDERAQHRDVLAERLDTLAAATWLPATSNVIDLAETLRAHDLTPSKLSSELGITPGDATDLARGDRAPTPEQAETLARLLDVDPTQLRSTPVDSDLVWTLDRPRFRRRLAERGAAEGEPDEAAWRLRVATTELPIAARITGPVDRRRRWMGLVESFLDER